MKNLFKLFILFMFSTVLHWACVSLGAEINVSVNIMLTFAFTACVFTDGIYGYSFAFLSGIFLDSFGTQMFGVYGLTFTLIARATYFLAKQLDFNNPLTQFVAVFILSVLCELMYSVLGFVFIKGVAWTGFTSLIVGSSINAALTPLMFYMFRLARLEREK